MFSSLDSVDSVQLFPQSKLFFVVSTFHLFQPCLVICEVFCLTCIFFYFVCSCGLLSFYHFLVFL